MFPNVIMVPTGVLFEDDKFQQTDIHGNEIGNNLKNVPYKLQIVWHNVLIFILLHTLGLYGVYIGLTSTKLITILYMIVIGYTSALSVTAGVHRLWAHRTHKAKLPLKLFHLFWFTMAYENSVIVWSRDHRVHHKYSETNADPHNIKRGFFFAHIGWLMCRKHPDVITAGKKIDLSDLKNDPLLVFQDKYYYYLAVLIGLILPPLIPVYVWGETWKNAFIVCNMTRLMFHLNGIWLINSAAHMWGNRPYEIKHQARDGSAFVGWGLGENRHNYHHTFPWDYKSAELFSDVNLATSFIKLMAKIGWAYDLKTAPVSMIRERARRTGDGSHPIWGWGDKDMSKEDMDNATILHSNKNRNKYDENNNDVK